MLSIGSYKYNHNYKWLLTYHFYEVFKIVSIIFVHAYRFRKNPNLFNEIGGRAMK